ncbi:MAG: hypothetical protein ACI9DK_003264, partial [Vicingaceae bacterium]
MPAKQSKKLKRKKRLLKAKKESLTSMNAKNVAMKNPKLPEFITCNDCGGKAPRSTF